MHIPFSPGHNEPILFLGLHTKNYAPIIPCSSPLKARIGRGINRCYYCTCTVNTQMHTYSQHTNTHARSTHKCTRTVNTKYTRTVNTQIHAHSQHTNTHTQIHTHSQHTNTHTVNTQIHAHSQHTNTHAQSTHKYTHCNNMCLSQTFAPGKWANSMR